MMTSSLLRPFKYLTILSLAGCVLIAYWLQGVWTFLPLAYAFGLVPLIELFGKPNSDNLSKAEEELVRNDALYDWMIYLIVPIQFVLLGMGLYLVQTQTLQTWEIVGLALGMGILCGTYGINVGHELGHRTKPHERLLAKLALLSSLYMHFYIEHNRGHHKRVSTEADPASARYGEWVYAFWFRSVIGGYLSAWELEHKRLKKKGLPVFSFHNEMIRFQLVQLSLLLLIGIVLGAKALLIFLLSATIGALLLETVNYIEHYGLQRQEVSQGKYERVQPHHSWNSDHVLGRLLLFELSRHSDHHFLASRKYQVLRHHEEAPQMPTGYPGMMLLSLVPPLWFRVMHRQLDHFQHQQLA
ncbi:MAG: alkane 1-monooxygenase [Bacteroidota bacterium]